MKIDGNSNGIPTPGQFMVAKNKETKKQSTDGNQTNSAGKNLPKKTPESGSVAGVTRKNATYSPQSITIAKATPGDTKSGRAVPVRADRIAEVRYRLEHGGYDNAEVVNTIIDRLLGELGK